jgi:hypothetical protein
MSFFKNGGKTGPVWGVSQWERGRYRRYKEGECGGNVMYSCIKLEKMRPAETRMRGGGIKENDGGGEFE